MRRPRLKSAAPWLLGSCLTAVTTASAFAQTAAPATPPVVDATKPADAAPAAPAAWMDTFTLGAQIELGSSINTASPQDNLNFGQSTTDKANTVLLNQILLTAQRLPDPKATDYDFGFQIQGIYGSDVRYYQFMGILNETIDARNQLNFINANVQGHLPWLTPGGIDVKAGMYPTPLGYEVIDPSLNPFYSHSYIFSYGLPLLATGGQAIVHVNDTLDIYGGVDSGINTTYGTGDNNGNMAGMGGLGLNGLLDGKLTVLALSHFGPETPRTVPNSNGKMRYSNDILFTYKATDALTLVTEFNLIRDDFAKANAYGAAQYISYALNDSVTLNGRAEIYRDDSGYFVAAFPGNRDFYNLEYGNPNTAFGAGAATYSEFTVGLTYKPTLPVPYLKSFAVRPELRYDRTLTNTNAFNDLTSRNQFTIAADVILGF